MYWAGKRFLPHIERNHQSSNVVECSRRDLQKSTYSFGGNSVAIKEKKAVELLDNGRASSVSGYLCSRLSRGQCSSLRHSQDRQTQLVSLPGPCFFEIFGMSL